METAKKFIYGVGTTLTFRGEIDCGELLCRGNLPQFFLDPQQAMAKFERRGPAPVLCNACDEDYISRHYNQLFVFEYEPFDGVWLPVGYPARGLSVWPYGYLVVWDRDEELPAQEDLEGIEVSQLKMTRYRAGYHCPPFEAEGIILAPFEIGREEIEDGYEVETIEYSVIEIK